MSIETNMLAKIDGKFAHVTDENKSNTISKEGGCPEGKTSESSNRFCSFNEVPLLLGANDIMKLTGLSRTMVYYLMHADGFPVITIGKRRLVRKEAFFDWLYKNEDTPRFYRKKL